MKYQNLIAIAIIMFSTTCVFAMYDEAPVEDAYVDSLQTSTTFNSETLQVQGAGSGFFVKSVQHSFLKFDVAPLEGKTILSAKFGIYLNDFSSFSSPSLQLYHVDDQWSQSGITWDNSSSLVTGAAMIGTKDQIDALGYYEWDVFASWDYGDLSDGYVSYMLTVGQQGLDNYAYFYSSESSVNQPYLRIEYIPEPASIAMLGLGSFLLGKRRRIKI